MTAVRLDEALAVLRRDVFRRSAALAGDARPEARAVLADSITVMEKLTGAFEAASRNRARVERLKTGG